MLTTQIWCRDTSWSIHVVRFFWIFTFSFPWQICSVEVVGTSKCNTWWRCSCKRRVGNSCTHRSPPAERVNGWGSILKHLSFRLMNYGWLASCKRYFLRSWHFVENKTVGKAMFFLYLRGLQTKSAKTLHWTDWSISTAGLELIESIKEEQASSTLQEIIMRLDVLSPKCGVDSFVLDIGYRFIFVHKL